MTWVHPVVSFPLIIIYDKSAIEPYNSKGLYSRRQGTLQYYIGEEKCILRFTTTDSVLLSLFWRPYMVINVVSVQYNGGFLLEIVLLTLCDNVVGEPL